MDNSFIPIEPKPKFITTKNVRNFKSVMSGLRLGAGEERLALIWGRAGLGKTRTSHWYAAKNGCIYLYMRTVWENSQLSFLQALARELGSISPPGKSGLAFEDCVERLKANPVPIFLDEMDKMPFKFLNIVRDLSKETLAPIILIGEETLVSVMERVGRLSSRTYQALEFEGIRVEDIALYAKETAGLNLPHSVRNILYKSSGGDFRLVRRDLIALVQNANAKRTTTITDEMAKISTQYGLRGKANGRKTRK